MCEMYLSIHASIYIYISTYLSIRAPPAILTIALLRPTLCSLSCRLFICIYIYIYICVCACVYLSIHLSIYLSINIYTRAPRSLQWLYWVNPLTLYVYASRRLRLLQWTC